MSEGWFLSAGVRATSHEPDGKSQLRLRHPAFADPL